MARDIVEPTTKDEKGPLGGTVSTHPAFAQIAVHRVSGRTNLYDSDFGHNAFVTISVRRSELHRSLSQDWHMADSELIEVAMSESQWATFVSSINMGSGVPCTLQALNGKEVPGLPAPQRRVDQFSHEMRTKMQKAFAALDEAERESWRVCVLRKHSASAWPTPFRRPARRWDPTFPIWPDSSPSIWRAPWSARSRRFTDTWPALCNGPALLHSGMVRRR